jgi:hypothetical protein
MSTLVEKVRVRACLVAMRLIIRANACARA